MNALLMINLRGLDEEQRVFARTWWRFWLIRQFVGPEGEKRYAELLPSLVNLINTHYALLEPETVKRCEKAKERWLTMWETDER